MCIITIGRTVYLFITYIQFHLASLPTQRTAPGALTFSFSVAYSCIGIALLVFKRYAQDRRAFKRVSRSGT